MDIQSQNIKQEHTMFALKFMVIKYFLLVLIWLFFIKTSLSAGPWTLEKGRLYIGLTSVYTTFDTIILKTGREKKPPSGPFNRFNFSLLAEFGILNDLEISALFPYDISIAQNKPDWNLNTFADSKFGLKFRILREEGDMPLTLALGSKIKLPLADYPTDRPTAPGDGQIDIDFALLIGKYFDIGITMFTELETGYRLRLETTPNEFFTFFQLGAYLTEMFSVNIFLDFIQTVEAGEDLTEEFLELEATEIYQFEKLKEDFLKLGLGFAYQITPKIDISIFLGTTVYAKNSTLEHHVGLNFGFQL